MPKSIRRMFAVAAVAGLALAQPLATARAAESEPPTEEGPRTVVKYVTCAGSLALAPNFYAAFAAIMLCAKLFTEEMTP